MANVKKDISGTHVDLKPVKGGWVARDATTGRLISVTTRNSTSFSSEKTRDAIGGASAKRSSALERLVNR